MTTPDSAGPTLLDLVRQSGPMPAEQCVRLAQELAERLAAGHAQGLMHGNLNPGTVILAPAGAHLVGGGAPAGPAGAAGDVYALGTVLVYAATGRASGDAQGITGLLREVITSCLASAPEHRPSAADLATMLRAASQGAPAPTAESDHARPFAPSPVPAQATPPTRRGLSRRGLLIGGVIGGAAVAVAGLATGIAVLDTSSSSPSPSPSPSATGSIGLNNRLPRLASATKRLAVKPKSGVTASAISAAHSASTVVVSPDRKLLAAGYTAGSLEDVGFVQVWSVPDGTWVAALPTHSGVGTLAFSQDGKTLAVGTDTIQLWNPGSATAPTVLPTGVTLNAAVTMSFAPDGKNFGASVEYGSENQSEVLTWKLSGTQNEVLATYTVYTNEYEQFFAYSPDGSSAVFGSNQALITWELGTNQRVSRSPDQEIGVQALAYSPDGTTVATVGAGSQLWDAHGTGAARASWRPSTPAGTLLLSSVQFSSKGAYVLGAGPADVVANSDDLYFWNAKTGLLAASHKSPAVALNAACFLPDDAGIAYCGAAADGGAGVWLQMFD